jgi:hypothetical protein
MTSNGTDPQLVPGWNVQASAPAPYSQPGITASTAALTATGNGSPGVPAPVPGNDVSILANPGYADASPSLIIPGTQLAAVLVPVPASGTAFTSPVALSCSVVITGGTVTAVAVKSLGAASAVEIGTGDGTYTIPPRAQVTLTYSAAPTWTWTTL